MTVFELMQRNYLGLITLGELYRLAREHNISISAIDEAEEALYLQRLNEAALAFYD